jgi:putative membrane-bound dehydrogenase-like protein
MKRLCALACSLSAAVAASAAEGDFQPSRSNYDFPVYTNQPPGKQITSGQLPATTHALSPEETRKRIEVPPGFEVRLFASEPMVVNPVAMTWDERGRLWVVELYEYPKGAPKGAKGRDRIKVLEDTDADGVADKVTVFADGFSLATGIALGNGGVYLGQAPDFLFLEDTNGDDKADKTTKMLTGFGMEDRHELLNGFAWGPDGWLYMTHGVFTHSKVKDPNAHDPDGFGVQMDAALARFHPATKKFEVFADGTSNPWGVDWNERGDAFVSACVIQHLFHMAPGGQYNRQGGTWANPYGYVNDLPTKGLPAIVDWRHYRAAHAGLTVYQGDQYPAEWRGLVMLGNIHASSINCDRLTPVGATYKADKESKLLGPAGEAVHKKSGEKIAKGEEWKHVGPGTFLVSQDPWFRPVSTQTGPDGAMWVMDWYDKYPCYQNAQADPEGVDRVYGRIWRVVWTGDQPDKAVPSRPSKGMDLAKLSGTELVELVSNTNSWQRRQAQRLLSEKFNGAGGYNREKEAVKRELEKVLRSSESSETRLAALWTLSTAGHLYSDVLDPISKDQDPAIRAWVARMTGARLRAYYNWRPPGRFEFPPRLASLAGDSDATVRAAASAAIRQVVSSALTVNEGPVGEIPPNIEKTLFGNLLQQAGVAGDTYYPHIVWMAMEPRVAADPTPFFPLLAANDNSVSAYCARRVMRRISDLSDASAREKYLNAAVQWLADNAAKTGISSAALDGLIEASKSKGVPPTVPLEPIFAKLNSNPALAEKAQRLAAAFGDKSAARMLIAKINDPNASLDDRLKGVGAAKEAKTDGAREELLKLLKDSGTTYAALKSEGVRSLMAFGYDQAYAVVDAWPKLPPMSRVAAAEVLARGTKTGRALLAGLENKTVAPSDISATARRAFANSEDKTIADTADRILGKYRASGADKLKLIAEKRAVVLAAPADANNGHEVAKKTCLVCHKMYGEGADVGPDLTGVGRSTLDALLHNVIDPNEVIGNGLEATEVTLKDDATVSGRVVEETETRIKLVSAGPTENTIAKSDIKVVNGKHAIRKTELSLMPEGLEQIPDKDFRDLIMFILNPPGDKRPWTPALRKELIGEEAAPQKAASAK